MTISPPFSLASYSFWLTRLFVVVVVLVLTISILVMNGGTLTYVLDDPYIHLSVSESILHGSYGVNPGEIASPSSSILYPFLLTIGAFSPTVHEWTPLVLNVLCLFATVEALRLFLFRIGLMRDSTAAGVAALLVAVICLAFNLIGIVFTGMEHNLHTLLTAAAVLGLVMFLEEGRLDWWFVASVALLPLVRYEGLALCLPIVLCLCVRGAWKTGLALGLFMVATLGAFSFFLVSHGLPYLPSSVLAKSSEMAFTSDGSFSSALRVSLSTLETNLGESAAFFIATLGAVGVAVLWADWRAHVMRNETLVAFVVVAFAVGQDAIGHFGWWGRYEVYAFVGASMMALYIGRVVIAAGLAVPAKRRRFLAGVLVVLAVLGVPYLRTLVLSPVSANNIYEQDRVVHRFVVEKLRGPVAVHDLGWASYHNENYVFDMLGLGSEEARRARPRNDLSALNPLIKAHGIKLAVLYRDWWLKNTPPDWQCVGQLHLSRRKGSPARSMIEFCATMPEYADEIRRLLREFKADLPPGVRLDVL
jgi:hypothetical protein